jgi:hypothetical protein
LNKKVKYGVVLHRYVKRYGLYEKMNSIIGLLGSEAQGVLEWAEEEAKRRNPESKNLGRDVFNLVGYEAAMHLVQDNQRKGRLTTKNEVKKKTGQNVEMPVLYRDAGLRHPQEARNLRHNMFHEAFVALITKLFPDVEISVPTTGEGLTPDLIVRHANPEWVISVEYKGYRSITLLSESEVLKGMRYQQVYGSAWLVTTSTKSVRSLYGPRLRSKEIVERGLSRLERIAKRRAYTEEQRENRGIARKGITHLEKHRSEDFSCDLITAEQLLESCRKGTPIKGVAISTGFEYVDLLREQGLEGKADSVLRVMKSPTSRLHSDTITSVRLLE